MDISISMELKTAAPNLCLGCVTANVKIRKTNDDLWAVIDKHIQYLTSTMRLESLGSIQQISVMNGA